MYLTCRKVIHIFHVNVSTSEKNSSVYNLIANLGGDEIKHNYDQ